MDLSTLRTFFQTAPLIYANIGRLAAENRTEAQLENLHSIQQDFTRAIKIGDAASAALYNHAFHAEIGQMAHNPYLVASLNRMLIDHTRLSQTFYRPTSAAETALITRAVDQHDAMITAIADQDATQIVDLTLQHWNLSRDRIERFVRPDPLPVDLTEMKGRTYAI